MIRMRALPFLLGVFLVAGPITVRGQYLTWHYDKLIETNAGQSASEPKVAISGLKAVAVWIQELAGKNRVYANNSTDGGKTWKTARLIEDNDQPANYASLAMSGNLVVTAWGNSGQVYVNTSLDGGQTWGSDQAIEEDAGTFVELPGPSVSISGTRVVVVWPESDLSHKRVYFNYSIDSGATWHDRAVLDQATSYDSFSPRVAISGLNAVAAFVRSDGANDHIYYAASTDGGVHWSTDQLLELVSDHMSYGPVGLAMSGSHAVAVWWGYSSQDIGRCVWANHSSNGGASWDGAQLLKPPVPSHAAYPQVAMSGARAVAAWPQLDQYWAQAVISVSSSTDYGATWGTAQPLAPPSAYPITSTSVALSGQNAVVAWTENAGLDSHIFANSSSNGGSVWRAARRLDNLFGIHAGHWYSVGISGTKAVAVWEEFDGATVRIASNYATGSSVQKDYLLPPTLSSPANGETGISTSIDLTWLDTNSNPQELKYKLRTKIAGGTYAVYTLAPNTVTYLKTGLKPGKTYYWNVMAVGNGTRILNSTWANGGKDFKFTVQP